MRGNMLAFKTVETMNEHALAYVSTATRPMSQAALEDLLEDARSHNSRYAVSGVLLYNDGAFFQYLEGAHDNLMKIYDRIKRSRQHYGLIELLNEPAERRYFDGWHMGFAEPQSSLLLRLSNAVWLSKLSDGTVTADNSPGLTLLLRFWRDAKRYG